MVRGPQVIRAAGNGIHLRREKQATKNCSRCPRSTLIRSLGLALTDANLGAYRHPPRLATAWAMNSGRRSSANERMRMGVARSAPMQGLLHRVAFAVGGSHRRLPVSVSG